MSEVRYEEAGGVVRITIDRPHVRNSLTGRTTGEVYAAVLRASRSDASVVVLRGEGADFCCGADVKSYHAGDAEPAQATDAAADQTAFLAAVLLHEMPAVTVAAVRGGCAGAGFGWACACDFRIADSTARFNTAFLDVGVAGDMGVPWTLPRIIGAARARDLSLFPRKFGAEEAEAMGLVSRNFPADRFEEELDGFVGALAAKAPLALRTLKENYVAAERLSLADYIPFETERHIALFATEDRVEAFAAFAEKRAPRFKGR
jgi:2-(1,2-epoxy-1,2-dihydrophenyl)acetyl-CoA isomerase